MLNLSNVVAVAAAIALGAVAPALHAQEIETSARHAFLIDAGTDTVLLEKAADDPMPPSSMAKMMTTYIAFDQIKKGELALSDTTTVSDSAWRQWAGSEGSLMFLGAGEEVTIADLLRGIIVSSGNDACTVLAEALAGSEEAFAEWMNDTAKELGMENSHFENASGWPDPDQYVTARDLAILAERTVEDFPELYEMYEEKSFTYGREMGTGRPITQGNRNPLLYTTRGADGLKTGHTEKAGYGLTGSAVRDGRRLILVLNGLESQRSRSQESARLIEWGFRNFKAYELFAAGDVVDHADVWLGTAEKVPLLVEDDIALTLGRRARNNMKVSVAFDTPIAAPIKRGDEIAELRIALPDREKIVVPLVAGADVGQIGGLGRFKAAFDYFVWGASSGE